MAACYPERPGPGTPDSERAVFTALARLPSPWRVFHSVAWQSVRDGRPGDGEADFVLVHPGVVVVLDEVDTDQERMLAYVGLSRAKSLLAILGPADVVSRLQQRGGPS